MHDPTGPLPGPVPGPGEGWVRAVDRSRLEQEGALVFTGADRPIVLFHREGQVYALDNRCPHMGFPLSRGTVEDGVLICHWHHARFDLASGCTFDLFADDAPSYETLVQGGEVYIRPRTGRDPIAYWTHRLQEGMAMDVSLVMVKATQALVDLGVAPRALAGVAGRFGATHRDAFGSGLVILTAMAHVAEWLPRRPAVLALAQGITRAAADAAGQAPHRARQPLNRGDLKVETAKRWMRHWSQARHRDGAERTLQTLLAVGASDADLADAVFSGVTDRIYADGGHTLDFTNKAFELADLIGGPEGPRVVLPTAVPGIVQARGAEESSAWHSPYDLVALLRATEAQIPAALRTGRGGRWSGVGALASTVLGDEPAEIVAALLDALRAGATPSQLAQAVAHAAALRIARFGTSNEFGDWDTALHTFTYCQAVHHALGRTASPEVLRGVFHGALSVYQDRFLNVPPARLPGADGGRDLEDLPDGGGELCARLLAATNAQGQVQEAARVTARYLRLGFAPEPLLAALAETVLREDAAFHTFQVLEAGIRLWRQWEGAPEGSVALIAVARYAAAHAPTQRSFLQTVDIAERLRRGEALHEDAD